MSNRGSITLSELQGKLDLLEIKCPSLRAARPRQSGAPDRGARPRYRATRLCGSLAGDCPNARTAALNSRCAIYHPQLSALFLPSKDA